MNIVNTKIDDLNYQVTLEIAAEDYAAAEKKKLNEIRRKAEFKGFRKGMVPMSLIQRVYGGQALGEAVNDIINEKLYGFIQENNLRVIGEPLPSEDQPDNEWKSGNSFTFKFDIAQTKELTFEPGKDDKVPYYAITVTEVAKKEMKENMLRQVGSLQDAAAAGEEDFVIADLDNGEKKVEEAYIAVRNVEGEAHGLFIGAKPGDQFDLDINAAFSNETDRAAMIKVNKDELAGINPVFHATVKTVRTFVAAEENQETFDKLFGEDQVHDAEEFDKAVADRLAANYKQEADYRLSKDLRDYLVEKAAIELPDAFLKRWLLHINEGKFTAEQIEAEYPAFSVDFRWQIIRDYLMGKYGLTIEEKDMQEAAESFVAYQYAMYGMGNVPHELIHESAQNILKDRDQLRRISDSVEDQKVIAAVRDAVTLQSKKISVEKFRELK